MPSSKINLISINAILGSRENEAFDSKELVKYLKERKDKKLLSTQDQYALISASKAWEEAPIENKDSEELKDRTGIYYCVGALPFEDKHLEKIAKYSQKDGEFNTHEFSNTAFNSMNPLLTFKCLPNMPLFHISYNLGITGRYFMTYPGVLDFFECLNKAVQDLNDNLIDYAIVGAACDQVNFLVDHHYQRTQKDLKDISINCASTIVLTNKENIKSIASLKSFKSTYEGYDPFSEKTILSSSNNTDSYTGPVEPLVNLYSQYTKKDNTTLQYTWQGRENHGASFEFEVTNE